MAGAKSGAEDWIPRGWRNFNPVPRPKGMRKRADRACFLNAWRIATDDRFRGDYHYAEGIAWEEDWGPIHHAWVVDRDGKAVDPTWARPGLRYVGTVLGTSEIKSPGAPSLPPGVIGPAHIAACMEGLR